MQSLLSNYIYIFFLYLLLLSWPSIPFSVIFLPYVLFASNVTICVGSHPKGILAFYLFIYVLDELIVSYFLSFFHCNT